MLCLLSDKQKLKLYHKIYRLSHSVLNKKPNTVVRNVDSFLKAAEGKLLYPTWQQEYLDLGYVCPGLIIGRCKKAGPTDTITDTTEQLLLLELLNYLAELKTRNGFKHNPFFREELSILAGKAYRYYIQTLENADV